MSVAFGTLMKEWIIPCMGGKAMRVEALEGNIGSVRVFEKNGFRLVDTVSRPVHNPSGVFHTGMHILTWRAE